MNQRASRLPAAEHEGTLLGFAAQRDAGIAQALEGLRSGIAQAQAGGGELDATAVLFEKAHAKLFFQSTDLSADGTVGHV